VDVKIIVFGGDGFCGWPTSLHLSESGYEVIIVDNLSRRKIDIELEANSLTPIKPIEERIIAWKEVTGKEIRFININIAKEYDKLLELIMSEKPDSIVHFAEQRAAPYSMKSSWHKRYTVDNNINATHNILAAIVESSQKINLVHLGTMGVYGYSNAGIVIPEGYLKVHIENDDGQMIEKEILYPASPGSIYHVTKTQDALLFQYYAANDCLSITDLHQGVVWGTQTNETKKDERLINRFDYDGDYGTVLNRFLMQAAIKYPLTVHGSGGQTRAFIHISDTVQCIRLAIENPPESGENVRIYNQVTETFRVRDLAEMISSMMKVDVEFIKNPRNESDENDLDVDNSSLIKLGLIPTKLQDELLHEIHDIAEKYLNRCDKSKIPCSSFWTSNK
tara:strand:+ start:120 stop:1295 length:1176 start_codon:yes stop_codon:yes gene_type:complete